ncbi:hypothetical protein PV383_44020 [Streptomyces caniscabiei]|uniref:Uncharacterized protein n=1 Tax=Streptomyces caniscabiei TaxID=2746961 RepID=A0ABU4N5G7_9ACTN|nr:hypothetical protein [Streptomyces caniscabiei]MDX2948873.1 hypothetical protein [Streptomyces caniscabiei]MDX3044082.1 hypothetical protein [Streptomyces caniscabiei]
MTDSYQFTTEDIAAMRKEGTHLDFLRALRRPSAGPTVQPVGAVSSAMPADHVPGGWPVAPTGEPSTATTGRRVCSCSECASYAKDRPTLEELLRRTSQHTDPPGEVSR